ncbi:hypothetical protein ANANG_G00133520 [Anguilla anguilla]|uniref:Uncharacterized protein n=1 Tax=Anguilla anguilla TaxID=7936 RepID=A0A9D3MFL0_ANGAN|nr:hypothetical protein ANANG_G00133520 [Anguilla anguilla]
MEEEKRNRRKQDGCPLGFVKEQTPDGFSGILQSGGTEKRGLTEGSLVDGLNAGQMETEKAGHEAEERLTPAPPNAVPRMEDPIAAVQNGNQSPEEALPQQTNGDVSWNHFKPNEGVNPRRSLGKKCSSPIRTQDLLDQSPHPEKRG